MTDIEKKIIEMAKKKFPALSRDNLSFSDLVRWVSNKTIELLEQEKESN
jgi:hypothetical protein